MNTQKYYHNYDYAHQCNDFNEADNSLFSLVLKSETLWSKQHPSILEAGCGTGPLSYLLSNKGMITGVDISETAINKAKSKFKSIEFIQMDLCLKKLNRKFDVIVDGHLLHCLIDSNDRYSYLLNINEMLEDDGIFIVESFIACKNMSFSNDYNYISPILWKKAKKHHHGIQIINESPYIPIRHLPHFTDLESEILNANFHIEILTVPIGAKGIIDQKTPISANPDLMQIICRKR